MRANGCCRRAFRYLRSAIHELCQVRIALFHSGQKDLAAVWTQPIRRTPAQRVVHSRGKQRSLSVHESRAGFQCCGKLAEALRSDCEVCVCVESVTYNPWIMNDVVEILKIVGSFGTWVVAIVSWASRAKRKPRRRARTRASQKRRMRTATCCRRCRGLRKL
jgi:hypothetical protein